MKNNFLTALFIVDVALSMLALFAFRHAPLFGAHGDHLSNFALSAFIVFCVGSVAVVRRKPLYVVGIIAGLVVVANIIVELFVSVMNTPDLVDAVYGIAGVAVSCGLLAVLSRTLHRRPAGPVRKDI